MQNDRIEKSWRELKDNEVDFYDKPCAWSWGLGNDGNYFASYTPKDWPNSPEIVYILPSFVGEMIEVTKKQSIRETQQNIISALGIDYLR